MTSCAFLCLTDGRDSLLDQTLRSAEENLKGPITRRIIHTDNGLAHRQFLQRKYPDYKVIGGERLGFGGAYNRAWEFVSKLDEPFVHSNEDDFVYNRVVDLAPMMRVLDNNDHLVQLVLKRQPWNEEEKAAGGIIEQHPDDYSSCSDEDGNQWVEHRRFFSTNPNLHRRSLCWLGWPTEAKSEGLFTHQLLQDPEIRFAFWGKRYDLPWVTHIGRQRIGSGY